MREATEGTRQGVPCNNTSSQYGLTLRLAPQRQQDLRKSIGKTDERLKIAE